MAKYKITVDKSVCIGCGACTSVSENFKLSEGEEVKAVVQNPEVDELKMNEKEAKELCPVDAIKIEKV